ncbi:MAG: hypothetical protein GXO48_02280 [Chlorobi bacterium]|nr:hypothetical protein [Chlorobiota bacterium]
MRKALTILTIGVLVGLSAFCRKEDKEGQDSDGQQPTVVSSASATSHYSGKNCMSCHNGTDAFAFSIAGTLYDSTKTNVYVGGTVEIYTGSNGQGTLIVSLVSDKNGNFYTTEQVNLSSGVYPSVKNMHGMMMHMPQPTTSGACNSCHTQGGTAPPIWVP